MDLQYWKTYVSKEFSIYSLHRMVFSHHVVTHLSTPMKSMQRRLLASYDVDSEKANEIEGGAYRNTTVDRLGNPIPAI
ncbi:hypothetical protein NC653_032853 [Populus alba x Populus x berolinensis]|uniref:Uncharacterized protein n=1 Tax=Populus alba x Populus x berolinensis TaxID=444605 RepID=A0AAD6PYL2_9ROSI|nr:hypothetical protein NC653_032853 [Populus alba x Populus x berolinensis]